MCGEEQEAFSSYTIYVIPAKAGIWALQALDPCFRRDDDKEEV